MSVEIKTAQIEPIRQTFGSVARRFGGDKPASRYQEASFDLQALDNFHYRPIWDPEREIYDSRRTALQMDDWEVFRDPRQFYYATYVIHRARMQEAAEQHFNFVEQHGLMAALPPTITARTKAVLLPLRHLEWAANNHNCFITAYGFGSSVTQGAMYNTMDRLGIAQYLSRIGLLLDGNTGTSLIASKRAWLDAPEWQPLRRLTEDLLVRKDWFELFVAQNLVLDGFVHPLVFGRSMDTTLTMLTGFMRDWHAENVKWVDACIKAAAGASAQNQALLVDWFTHWVTEVARALQPIAVLWLGDQADAAIDAQRAALTTRAARLGLAVQ